MAFNYANVLVFALIAIGFIVGGLTFGRLVRPNIPDPEKSTIYECGERPIGLAWFKFNPRFYLIALVFVIFDVEIAFMFPVVTVFRQWVEASYGWVAFFEITAFVGILSVALAYVWTQGDLEWVKKSVRDLALKDEEVPEEERRAA